MKVSHTAFSLGFPTILYAACNALNIDKLARWFRDAQGVDHVALIAYLLAGLCLFIAVFTLFAHRWTIKPFAILITVLGAAATYFIAKYDVAIDSSMLLNTLHTDPTEVGQLLSLQMVPYVLLLMALPVYLILASEITFQPSGRYLLGSLGVFAGAMGLALALLYSNYSAVLRAGNISHKHIVYSLVPINILSSSASVVSKAVSRYRRSRLAAPEVPVSITRPGDLVVVLAIGESSRRKSFSLYGYERRNTNPALSQVPGLHLLNGIATEGSTLNALREILEKQEIKLSALVAKAGIPTTCFVNFTMYDNCAAVGEVAVSDCDHGGKCYDEDVIPLLEGSLKEYQSGYRFLVLHLGGGSHGPAYGNRIPPEFQKFQPTCQDADVVNQCTREQLFNSYDNTILYVDHVLHGIIQSLDSSRVPYVLIYMSDHGESLLEDGHLFHGMPPGMSLPKEQAEVPLIVKASVPISIVAREQYHQPEVFDSVLRLFSLASPAFDQHGSFILRDEAAATPP